MRMGFRQCQAHRVFNQKPNAQQLQHGPIAWDKDTHRDPPLNERPLLRSGVHLDAVDDDSRRSLSPDFQRVTYKIVCQGRHVTDGQFPNLASADPLRFLYRTIAIFQDTPSVDQERLTRGR
jgi:hypothetical protein